MCQGELTVVARGGRLCGSGGISPKERLALANSAYGLLHAGTTHRDIFTCGNWNASENSQPNYPQACSGYDMLLSILLSLSSRGRMRTVDLGRLNTAVAVRFETGNDANTTYTSRSPTGNLFSFSCRSTQSLPQCCSPIYQSVMLDDCNDNARHGGGSCQPNGHARMGRLADRGPWRRSSRPKPARGMVNI